MAGGSRYRHRQTVRIETSSALTCVAGAALTFAAIESIMRIVSGQGAGMLARRVLLTRMVPAAGPAVAHHLGEGLPPPNALAPFPNCTATDGNGKPTMQPYAFEPQIYGGIYMAVEQRFAPLGRHFFPVLQVDDSRYWVRITRTTRGGARPPDRLTIAGAEHNLLGEAGSVPVIMKIDKCNGAIMEMSFDKDKLMAALS